MTVPFEQGMLLALREGHIGIPGLLLRTYASLELSEVDMMLIIHLLYFKEKEQTDFPTIEQLQTRLSAAPDVMFQSLQKLMSEGWIAIDEDIDPQTGIHYERYNMDGVFEKLAAACTSLHSSGALPERAAGTLRPFSGAALSAAAGEEETDEMTEMFGTFEREFGRLLSPMECETIAGWLDKDRYPIPLIYAALKESVFAGKVHFRYIDRILLEWKRHEVRTPEDAKAYAARYRGR